MCPASNVPLIQRGFCQVGLTKQDKYINYELNSENPRNDNEGQTY